MFQKKDYFNQFVDELKFMKNYMILFSAAKKSFHQ